MLTIAIFIVRIYRRKHTRIILIANRINFESILLRIFGIQGILVNRVDILFDSTHLFVEIVFFMETIRRILYFLSVGILFP